MNRRLSPRQGEWIDRNRPLEFQFEGKSYHGFAGDVVSSALWANDVRLLGRSFKYHRPRSIYSLAGHDANVMIENGRRTNLRPTHRDLGKRTASMPATMTPRP